MISCAKEVLYIVYMKRLQYYWGLHVVFLFNETLHSNSVALIYRKKVPHKTTIERRKEVLNLSHLFLVL